MPSVPSAIRRRLPPPVAVRVQRLRGRLAHLIAGPELHQARVDAERQAAEVSQAVLHELQRAVNDLLERQDVILASYDRRVAALTNRVLELEDRLPARVASGRIADANELLADHEPVDGVNGNR